MRKTCYIFVLITTIFLRSCNNSPESGNKSSLSASVSKKNICNNATDNSTKSCGKDYVLKDDRGGLIDRSEYYDGYIPEEGFVPTPAMAVRIAEIVLHNIYGREKIEKQKPFFIRLENDIWKIKGQFHPPKSDVPNTYTRAGITYNADGTVLSIVSGGNVYIEISKSNGAILKVVHTK